MHFFCVQVHCLFMILSQILDLEQNLSWNWAPICAWISSLDECLLLFLSDWSAPYCINNRYVPDWLVTDFKMT